MLFLTGVAGNVQVRMAVIDDLRALVEERVDHAADRSFVAGDGRGRDDHAVAGTDRDLLVLGKSHAVESGHALALAAGRDDDDLILGQLVDLLDIGHHVLRDIHIAQDHGNADDVFHAAPGDRDLAAVPGRNGNDLLQTVHVGSKGRDDDALVAAGKKLVKALTDLPLRGGMSRVFRVCGIAQQREHAFLAELAEAREIDHPAGDRRQVDLEIARVHHGAERRSDGKRHGIGDAVVDVDEFYRKTPETKRRAGLPNKDLRVVEQVMLLEFEFNERGRERQRVDGDVQFPDQIRHGADVVLMTMGQDQAADPVCVCFQV